MLSLAPTPTANRQKTKKKKNSLRMKTVNLSLDVHYRLMDYLQHYLPSIVIVQP